MYISKHDPVLQNEIKELFSFDQNTVYVDATLGFGGHAKQILDNVPSIQTLVGIDMDTKHLEYARNELKPYSTSRTLIFEHNRFENVFEVCQKHKLIGKVTSILFDFGICSAHIDNPERGFSYMHNGPLDMRMDGQAKETAKDIVNTADVQDLTNIIRTFGEEKHAYKIALAIEKQRKISPIETTFDLVHIIETLFPSYKSRDPITKTFQALRIRTNNELTQIQKAITSCIDILRPGGIVACISYHSLEDRIVKNIFRDAAKEYEYTSTRVDAERIYRQQGILLTKKPIVPKQTEIEYNTRARSAKLRALKKI